MAALAVTQYMLLQSKFHLLLDLLIVLTPVLILQNHMGEKLKLFYNPAATKLVPNEEFGIAFNGGFNQPIMCGGEPRAMLCKTRGKADSPIHTIQICIPKHDCVFKFQRIVAK